MTRHSTSNYNIAMRENNAIDLITRIREKVNRYFVKELETRGIKGIVPSHGSILMHLYDGRDLTMKELAEKINRTKPTVTVLVDKLAECGYVTKEKSPDDNRVTFIRLTEDGRALKPTLDEIADGLDEVVYGSLTDREALDMEIALWSIDRSFDGEFKDAN